MYNEIEHGIEMPEALPVFDDPHAITILWRAQNIRTISARPAEAHEREEYEAQR